MSIQTNGFLQKNTWLDGEFEKQTSEVKFTYEVLGAEKHSQNIFTPSYMTISLL